MKFPVFAEALSNNRLTVDGMAVENAPNVFLSSYLADSDVALIQQMQMVQNFWEAIIV